MLREYSHDQKFCFLPQKSFMSETGRSQGNVEKASKSVSPSTIVVVPDPIVSYSINLFSYEDSRKHSRGPS
jgi:hypothetical protein